MPVSKLKNNKLLPMSTCQISFQALKKGTNIHGTVRHTQTSLDKECVGCRKLTLVGNTKTKEKKKHDWELFFLDKNGQINEIPAHERSQIDSFVYHIDHGSNLKLVSRSFYSVNDDTCTTHATERHEGNIDESDIIQSVVENNDNIRKRLRTHRSNRKSRLELRNMQAADYQTIHMHKEEATMHELRHNMNEKAAEKTRWRFSRAVTAVCILRRLLAAMIEKSDEKTIRTATEYQWQTLYSRRETTELAFNKFMFARNRNFVRVPNWARDIVSKDPDIRSEEDCWRLHALLRGMKSFDMFTEKIQISMCRSFSYTSVAPGRVVLRQGHVGHNFYFIFSGSVFINIDDISESGQCFPQTETVLYRGDSFGELALLQHIRRTATVTAREQCEFLFVHKEVFAQLCPRIFDDELVEKELFLRQMSAFPAKFWSQESIRNLCMEAQIQEYKTNKVVVTDSGSDDWIYICMEGKCQVVRCLTVNKCRRSKAIGTETSSYHIIADDIMKFLEEMEDENDSEDEVVITDNNKSQPKDGIRINVDDKAGDNNAEEREIQEHMLDSMALDYTTTKKNKKRKEAAKKVVANEKPQEQLISGPVTLTTLMAQDLKNGWERIYLSIGVVAPWDIFDFNLILNDESIPVNGQMILVSMGSRLLRIKKTAFFSIASGDAQAYTKMLASKQQYPSDELLLESFHEKSIWDEYKTGLVQATLKSYLQRIGKIEESVIYPELTKVKERHRKINKMLMTLRKKSKMN